MRLFYYFNRYWIEIDSEISGHTMKCTLFTCITPRIRMQIVYLKGNRVDGNSFNSNLDNSHVLSHGIFTLRCIFVTSYIKYTAKNSSLLIYLNVMVIFTSKSNLLLVQHHQFPLIDSIIVADICLVLAQLYSHCSRQVTRIQTALLTHLTCNRVTNRFPLFCQHT